MVPAIDVAIVWSPHPGSPGTANSEANGWGTHTIAASDLQMTRKQPENSHRLTAPFRPGGSRTVQAIFALFAATTPPAFAREAPDVLAAPVMPSQLAAGFRLAAPTENSLPHPSIHNTEKSFSATARQVSPSSSHNAIHFDWSAGATVASLSVRRSLNTWGVRSTAAELAALVPLGQSFYVEPKARFYHQKSNNQFHDYLSGGESRAIYSALDLRPGRFNSGTASLKIGYRITPSTDLYLIGEEYLQSGASKRGRIPGAVIDAPQFNTYQSQRLMAGLEFRFR
jgi:hypothetical protein